MMYGLWFLRYQVQQTDFFCHFGLFFALLPPLTTQKIKLLKKWKKHSGDIIILHMSTINKNHLPINKPKNQNFGKMKKPLEISYFSQVYHEWCSWDMACDRCNCYFLFWAIFCPFTPPSQPLTAQKINNFQKNLKNDWKYHHFTQVDQKTYAILFLRYSMWHM